MDDENKWLENFTAIYEALRYQYHFESVGASSLVPETHLTCFGPKKVRLLKLFDEKGREEKLFLQALPASVLLQ